MSEKPVSSGGMAVSSAALDDAARALDRQVALERRWVAARAVAFALRQFAFIFAPALLVVVAIVALLTATDRAPGDVTLGVSSLFAATSLIAGARLAKRVSGSLERRVLTVRAPRPPMSILQRVSRYTAVGTGILIATTWLLILVALDHGFRRDRAALHAEFAAWTPQFLRDRAQVAASPLFANLGNERDAGKVLNNLGWAGKRQPSVPASPSLTLPGPLPPNVDKLVFDAISIEDVGRFDTAWMHALTSFDHWDIDAAAPRAARPFDFMEVFPDFGQLLSWAKVRAARGYLLNDVRTASDELHAVARLTTSTETLIGTMVGAAVLTFDRRMIDAERHRHPSADLSWWIPFTEDDARVTRRASFASLSYLNPEAPAGAWAQVDGSLPNDCIAWQEGLYGLGAGREELRDFAPGILAASDVRIVDAAAHCRFHGLRETWSDTPAPSTMCDGQWNEWSSEICFVDTIGRWVPFAERAAWRYLAVSCSAPNACFKLYRG